MSYHQTLFAGLEINCCPPNQNINNLQTVKVRVSESKIYDIKKNWEFFFVLHILDEMSNINLWLPMQPNN